MLPFSVPCGKHSCVKKLMVLIQIQGKWGKVTEKSPFHPFSASSAKLAVSLAYPFPQGKLSISS